MSKPSSLQSYINTSVAPGKTKDDGEEECHDDCQGRREDAVTFVVEIAAILPWPGSDSVSVCAWLRFVPGRPLLVVHTGSSTWRALWGVFAQAQAYSRATAYVRN